jgi:tRNA modification GTPase
MNETIAAIATPPGRGAIAIVRCSGPHARAIAARVFRSREPLVDRVATYGTIVDRGGGVIDRGLALAMDAPRTVTGEEVVELHLHGSPVVVRETLRALLQAGARAAEPGEFTRRAFLNGKIDLSAAEAVADIIAAESDAALRAAQANLAGALRDAIDEARRPLLAIVEELSGAIDYPDEIAEPQATNVRDALHAVEAALAELERDWERGRLIREGLSVAIVGPPNAGKSTLLNALLGEERAIVSPWPGTTRDTIEEAFVADGITVRAIDTAGLRTSAEPIERSGIERTRSALAAATLALVIVDGSEPLDPDARLVLRETRARPRVVLFNKRDLGSVGYAQREAAERDALSGSAHDRATIEKVRAAVAHAATNGATLDVARPHLASARQADAVTRARTALAEATATVAAGEPLDLAVPSLVAAVAALGEITGAEATEAILSGIFARFCVGK